MNFFAATSENLKLHNEPEQKYRQEGISKYKQLKNTSEQTIQEILEEKEIVETYHTTLSSCTCADFEERRLPCIHIYRLANILGLFKSPNLKRTEKIIADFSKGYADGWKFIVRPCNYGALDIGFTERTRDKKRVSVLTQGTRYEFVSGSIFYDNIAAYEETWGEALKKIKRSVQIIESTSTDIDYMIDLEKIMCLDEDRENGNCYKLETEFAIFRRNPILEYGTVKFNAYGIGNEKIGEYSCRQDEFVKLLQKGKFKDINNRHINLFETAEENIKVQSALEF